MKQTPFKGVPPYLASCIILSSVPVWKVYLQVSGKTRCHLGSLPVHLQHIAMSMLNSTGRRRQRARLKLLEGLKRIGNRGR